MDLSDFVESGKIASKIREESKGLIIIDQPLLEIAETIEEMIRSEGAEPAFPCNISLNNIAAHYTPPSNDQTTLTDSDVVKIDIGVSLNGAIADTAYTVDLSGKYSSLLEASKRALEKAVSKIKAGITIKEISAEIEDTIKSFGYLPISNLTGHKISHGFLHAGIELPNVKNSIDYSFKPGDVFAVEPFASTGQGFVNDSDQVEIFSLYQPKSLRSRKGREILHWIVQKRGFLPFSQRWIENEFGHSLSTAQALKEMIERKVLITYPVLKETTGSVVSQFEHTVIVEEDGCKITTK